MGIKRTIFYLLFGFALALGLSFILVKAGSIDFSKPGVSMWVYLTVAAFVLLLETGPVVILLTSIKSLMRRPIDWNPIRWKSACWIAGLIIGFILGSNVVWARSINISQAGTTLWIFIGIGLVIVLLQLIPAIILFISLVGYATKLIHDKIPVEDKATIPFSEKEKCGCGEKNKNQPSG